MSRNHRRLNAKRWAFVRRKVLDAANWQCAKCNKYANEVDHVQPLEKGGDAWDEANLQCLCKSCHIEKTSRENERHDPARDAWRRLVDELIK